VETNPMVVMMATGIKVVTNSKCLNFKFSLQGHEFWADMRILDIKGYDMILGLDWLAQYRPMQVDWLEK
jgi:Retroviral aspartyl protease